MTTALRVGLVGTGLWARQVHAAALLAHPDVEFVGVWGRDRARARAIADPARIGAFGTLAALLDAVEAVTIAIPPAAQAPIALEAARAGKHVMMEKLVAMTAALADELEAAVLQRGVGSVVCFTGRWIPEFEQWLTSLAGQDGWSCGRAEIVRSALAQAVRRVVGPRPAWPVNAASGPGRCRVRGRDSRRERSGSPPPEARRRGDQHAVRVDDAAADCPAWTHVSLLRRPRPELSSVTRRGP